MKSIVTLVLIFVLLLSLTAGCRISDETLSADTGPAESVSEPEETVTGMAPGEVDVTVPKNGLTVGAGESDIPVETAGQLRLTYAGNVSTVRYVTSAAELPDYPELQDYDDAFFREHALLLVTETVGSGNVQVEIHGIRVDGDTAAVTLSHESQGDVGTAVMTTWLVWAVVEPGLDYTWTVENPAVKPETEQY